MTLDPMSLAHTRSALLDDLHEALGHAHVEVGSVHESAAPTEVAAADARRWCQRVAELVHAIDAVGWPTSARAVLS